MPRPIRTGQPVTVRLDAYPDIELRGRILQLGPIAAPGSFSPRVRSFTAIVGIDGSHARVLPDLSAAVDVEVERVHNALVVPRSAVHEADGHASVSVGGSERTVTLGPRDAMSVVITDGLRAGDEVAAMRRRIAAVATIVALSGALVAWMFRSSAPDVPTSEVTLGDFFDEVPLRGEIKAGRSIVMLAPADAGQLRIITHRTRRIGREEGRRRRRVRREHGRADDRGEAQRGETSSTPTSHGFESQSRTKESEAATTSTNSQYDVKKAEVEYSGSEVMSRVESEQKRLKVLDAEQKHAEADAALASAQAGGAGRPGWRAAETGEGTPRARAR